MYTLVMSISVHITHLVSPYPTLSRLTSFHLREWECNVTGRSHGELGRALWLRTATNHSALVSDEMWSAEMRTADKVTSLT